MGCDDLSDSRSPSLDTPPAIIPGVSKDKRNRRLQRNRRLTVGMSRVGRHRHLTKEIHDQLAL